MRSKDVDPRRFITVEEKRIGFAWVVTTQAWQPAIDVCGSRATIIVRAEMPGVAPEDLSVRVKGATLVLSGTKRRPPAGENLLCYMRLERVYGEFSQEIVIDWPLDAERASASLRDGILTVELPKLEKVVEVPITKKPS